MFAVILVPPFIATILNLSNPANLLHPQFLDVFLVMWPADARAFSRPSHFFGGKSPGDEIPEKTGSCMEVRLNIALAANLK